ncbi:TPA: IS110 family transposase, partial [Enterococcus faecium]|nr:IS110 family transposase [Enterococcus faecium]
DSSSFLLLSFSIILPYLIVDLKLCNRTKNIPGQKTDKKDASWIAKLLRVDLIPKSFVPEEPIQDLRELTRLRKMWIESRNREKNRAHKILQTAGIKLTSYMTDIFGLSGRNLLNLLINEEEITAEKVEKAVYTSLKFKVPELIEGLTGFFRSHHRFLLAQVLDVIDMYTSKISELEIKIADYLLPYQQYVDSLVTIPGISLDSAAVIISEFGTNMNQFSSAERLASWVGLCPGNNESAGKRRSTRISKGNSYAKKILCQCAYSACKSNHLRFRNYYQRISQNRGGKRATVAVAHLITRIIYYMLMRNEVYHE